MDSLLQNAFWILVRSLSRPLRIQQGGSKNLLLSNVFILPAKLITTLKKKQKPRGKFNLNPSVTKRIQRVLGSNSINCMHYHCLPGYIKRNILQNLRNTFILCVITSYHEMYDAVKL